MPTVNPIPIQARYTSEEQFQAHRTYVLMRSLLNGKQVCISKGTGTRPYAFDL